jgi:hypothetical protein
VLTNRQLGLEGGKEIIVKIREQDAWLQNDLREIKEALNASTFRLGLEARKKISVKSQERDAWLQNELREIREELKICNEANQRLQRSRTDLDLAREHSSQLTELAMKLSNAQKNHCPVPIRPTSSKNLASLGTGQPAPVDEEAPGSVKRALRFAFRWACKEL